MSRMIRFFPYYGAKQSRASLYPIPDFDTVIEPFAGSAAYSTLHHTRKVILIEKHKPLADMWEWLINVKEDEFLSMPTLEGVDRVSDLDLTEHQETYVRYWASVCTTGRDKVSPFVKAALVTQPCSMWSEKGKVRLSGQLSRIRNWRVIHGDYTDAPDITATWFVDPPYTKGGEYYSKSCKSSDLDYKALGAWCRGRKGQSIVCESASADWLPFVDLGAARKSSSPNAGKGRAEGMWTDTEPSQRILF